MSPCEADKVTKSQNFDFVESFSTSLGKYIELKTSKKQASSQPESDKMSLLTIFSATALLWLISNICWGDSFWLRMYLWWVFLQEGAENVVKSDVLSLSGWDEACFWLILSPLYFPSEVLNVLESQNFDFFVTFSALLGLIWAHFLREEICRMEQGGSLQNGTAYSRGVFKSQLADWDFSRGFLSQGVSWDCDTGNG